MPLRASKSEYHNGWKSDSFIGSKRERPNKSLYNPISPFNRKKEREWYLEIYEREKEREKKGSESKRGLVRE